VSQSSSCCSTNIVNKNNDGAFTVSPEKEMVAGNSKIDTDKKKGHLVLISLLSISVIIMVVAAVYLLPIIRLVKIVRATQRASCLNNLNNDKE
jgi:hypothetical protein